MKHEHTSKRIAAIAGRVLKGGRFSLAELRALAASALTQARDNPKKKRAR
jgi:hypothetical protein